MAMTCVLIFSVDGLLIRRIATADIDRSTGRSQLHRRIWGELDPVESPRNANWISGLSWFSESELDGPTVSEFCFTKSLNQCFLRIGEDTKHHSVGVSFTYLLTCAWKKQQLVWTSQFFSHRKAAFCRQLCLAKCAKWPNAAFGWICCCCCCLHIIHVWLRVFPAICEWVLWFLEGSGILVYNMLYCLNTSYVSRGLMTNPSISRLPIQVPVPWNIRWSSLCCTAQKARVDGRAGKTTKETPYSPPMWVARAPAGILGYGSPRGKEWGR